jgi:hypothetical protein
MPDIEQKYANTADDRLPEGKTDGKDIDVGPRKKSKKEVEKFLKIAVKRFNKAEGHESKNRMAAVEDLKFKANDQWPEQIKTSRTTEKRPCLTINKMKTFVHQITNDQRQNRPAINVSPVGDKSDPETAKMLKGLIKHIERNSNADIAYDTGFDSAVSMGWGYWRILTEYEDEDSFDQVIRIKRISNPFRVYLDPDSDMPDGSDAKWCFISDLLTRDEFEQEFPDADPMPWEEGAIGDEYKSWNTATHIRIAEYFCIETETRTLVKLKSGHVGWWKDLDDSIKKKAESDEDFIVEERDVPVKKICWYKITSKEILEENDWLGSHIPVIRVIGDEVNVDGKNSYAGLIRDAKDAQRMYNFWVTSETELIALAPKAPWIMEEGQIEGHEQRWQTANVKSLPYLLYKGTNIAGKPSPPPQRQQFAGPPAGVVQAKISAAQDMQATTGIRFDATLQERNYDESGKALRELKRVGDLGNFHYVDNLSRSLRFTGVQLIDLIPKIYDTPRIVTILREDDSEETVKIDPTLGKAHSQQQLPDGRIQRLFNPKLGEYSVAVTIGPSFATKRAEAADSMLNFLKVIPNSAPLVADLIAKNMDWPGADEIYTRLASQLPPHLQNKNIQNFPPEAKGLINSMMQQMQQLKQEHDQAVQMLGDKERDRAIDKEALQNERDSIRADLEAKLTKIAVDLETKMAAIQAKGKEKDDSVQYTKIASDFEAKVLKIVADLEAKRLQAEAKEKMDQKKMEMEKSQGDKQERTRHSDIAQFGEAIGKQSEALTELVKTIAKPRTRKGKVKGPSGRTFEMEIMDQ